jgi:hypothetical protein
MPALPLTDSTETGATMFAAQLAAFLIHHHHAMWAAQLTTDSLARFARALAWALRHGFVYQR